MVTFDERGLAPAIVVDAASGEVLTLAWMNAESLALTRETGQTWFWSRSRQELWNKGATSGNTQEVVSLEADCDHDALVVRVRPAGPACHLGTRSCWTGSSGGILSAIDDQLSARAVERPAGSYTVKLLDDENLRIKKLGEENAELLKALLTGDDEECVGEAADLLFHLAVALRARGIGLHAVLKKLEERHKP